MSVDHADTGIDPGERRRPGHAFQLQARQGGVLVRAGHTEAAVDLIRLAGRSSPVGVSELVGDDGEMLRGPAVAAFAVRHDLEHVADAAMSTVFGDFRAVASAPGSTAPTISP